MVRSTFSITLAIRSLSSMPKPLLSPQLFRSEELQNSQRSMKQRGAFTATSKTRAKSWSIDADKHEVVAHWPLAPGEGPSGIALDASASSFLLGLPQQNDDDARYGKRKSYWHHCSDWQPASMAARSTIRCSSPSHRAAMEPLPLLKEEAPNKLTVVQTLKTERGARTMALDPQTHRIYLPTAQFQPPPSPSPGTSPGRPSVVPNTLKLLVYGPTESVKH